MKVVHLSASDSDGAGTAARRIHEGLLQKDVQSRMVVAQKEGAGTNVEGPNSKIGRFWSLIRPQIDAMPLSFYKPRTEFSLGWLPGGINRHIGKDVDLLQLHWLAGFLDFSALESSETPVVWRLPDMWPMTGGCHYAMDCTRYRESCGKCPQLGSSSGMDPTQLLIRRKRKMVEEVDLTVVSPSLWTADRAARSSVFEGCTIEVIPNGLDTTVFCPVDPTLGRDLFGLPKDKDIILSGAVDPASNSRKGFDLLEEAINTVGREAARPVELVLFGNVEESELPELGVDVTTVGYLGDEQSLSLLYSASDAMVVPSLVESFGQTVTEAMACGTPVVAFDNSGPSDLIEHERTGYLAEAHDPEDLAKGVSWILEDERRKQMGKAARQRAVERYDLEVVAEEYLDLYIDLLGSSGGLR